MVTLVKFGHGEISNVHGTEIGGPQNPILVRGKCRRRFYDHCTEDTGWTKAQKESQSTEFECPRDQVMIGRKHDGGENGKTMYKCALMYNDGYKFYVSGDKWSDWTKESTFTYIYPLYKVMTGREHQGGEGGKTRYKCSDVIDTKEYPFNSRLTVGQTK